MRILAKEVGDWLDGIEVDERVRGLVAVLNTIPGVWTLSSCGGHKRPRRSQVGSKKFQVSLTIDQNRQGWCAIALITKACEEINDTFPKVGADKVRLRPWLNGEWEDYHPRVLDWDLSGEEVSPDAVGTEISSRMGVRNVRLTTRPAQSLNRTNGVS
jgi:hypothetical protein